MKKNQHKKGLTLVELMVAIVAASIVILTVAVILIAAFRSWRINNAYVDMRRDAALAIYLISRDIREATLADVATPANQLVLPTVTYTKTAGGALISTDFGTIILRNVTRFNARTNGPGDGVYITLGVADNNTGIGIAITNTVFVNTRN